MLGVYSGMGQRRHHYEQAFERYLRDSRIPYISVNEAKKSLLPERSALMTKRGDGADQKLKNFDFVVYGAGTNLLVEIKGRRLPAIRLKDGTPAKPRMESWVTLDDIEALSRWRELFGPEFEPVFVFVYWCDDVPPDGLFVETLVDKERWYTLRAITLDAYVGAMKVRSPRWRTMNLFASDFEALSRPFCVSRDAIVCPSASAKSLNGGALGSADGYIREPIFERLGDDPGPKEQILVGNRAYDTDYT